MELGTVITSTKFYLKRTRVAAFIIDETMLQIGSDYAWLWVSTEPIHKQVLGVHVSRHRNMLVAEYFIRSLIKLYGKHILYIQMADHGILRHVLILV
jgi:transposase-like protein